MDNVDLNTELGFHVENQKETDLLMKYFKKNGVRWICGDRLGEVDMYHVYKSETTYVVHEHKLQYGTKSTCLDLGIKVIEVSNLLPKIRNSNFLRI